LEEAMNAERIKELREWLEDEYIGMVQALGMSICATDLPDQMGIVKDIEAVLDDYERLRAEVERLRTSNKELIQEGFCLHARAEKAEAEVEKFKDLYKKTEREMDFIHERANIREVALKAELDGLKVAKEGKK
jgi:predicted nuclease with TOPRIM domain